MALYKALVILLVLKHVDVLGVTKIMPNDLFFKKKIFPDASLGFKFFHYTKGLKKGILTDVPIVETTVPEWFKFPNPNLAELKVCALGSESLATGNTDNLQIAMQQKFLATINDFKNIEASWYLQYFSGTDPWCISARSGGRINYRKPCLGAGYKAFLKPDGTVRFCKDVYTGNRSYYPENEWFNAIAALTEDQIVGMKFICFNIDDDTKVHLELWIDELNNNDWKRKLAFTDTGFNWGSGATRCKCVNDRQPITWGGPTVTFTCQGNSPANTDYSFTNATVREVNGGGVFAEATAGSVKATAGGDQALVSIGGTLTGSNTGGGVGDGAGGVCDDTSTGTGDVNDTEPQFVVQPTAATASTGFPFPFPLQTGTTGTTSSPIGSPTTGTNATPTDGSNQRPERPLVTVYKDLGFIYNIVLDSSSPCDVGNPFTIDYRQIYQAGGVDTQEIKLYPGTGGIIRTGAKAHSSVSALVNKVIRKVTVTLRKFGNPTTGRVRCEIRNRSGVLMHTFALPDNGYDPATIPIGAFSASFTFTSDGNTYVMQAGDMVLITYTDATDANANNCIIMKSSDKDEIDGFDTVQVNQSDTGVYSVDQNRDFVATIMV